VLFFLAPIRARVDINSGDLSNRYSLQ